MERKKRQIPKKEKYSYEIWKIKNRQKKLGKKIKSDKK